jgi:hypothetical protein
MGGFFQHSHQRSMARGLPLEKQWDRSGFYCGLSLICFDLMKVNMLPENRIPTHPGEVLL